MLFFSLVCHDRKKQCLLHIDTFFFLPFRSRHFWLFSLPDFFLRHSCAFVFADFTFLRMDFGSKYIYKYAHSEEESVSDEDNALDNDADGLFIPQRRAM